MCGIIGAVAQRDIVDVLLEGLRRLEYRGYDSSGILVSDTIGNCSRLRRVGKVQKLIQAAKKNKLRGSTGVAHTRWATHGEPSVANTHPHTSDYITVVHNGIIENYESLRETLIERGYFFSSDTDTEVIAHLIHSEYRKGDALLRALQRAIPQMRGNYSIVVMDKRNSNLLVALHSGSPLVIGIGMRANFIASDQIALLPVTRRFVFLEEGDLVEITHCSVRIIDKEYNSVERPKIESHMQYNDIDKGPYHHYMQKEIYEQPIALKNTLEGRIKKEQINLSEELGSGSCKLFKKVQHVQIIACGTSYHAGMVARYWFESLSEIPCDVELASEFRYRKSVVRPGSLIIMLSQSGETADTLAALRLSKTLGYIGSLVVCNVAGSSLVRESDLVLMTKAGTEIGVASTKAFTTQLVVLLMLVVHLGRLKNMNESTEHHIALALQTLSLRIEKILLIDKKIKILAEDFSNKQHALFLGRGAHYPVAMEGALKLKEISYIHAEAYAGGELKHGPLALIDPDMPVIVVAPNNQLLEKLKSNIEAVRARGGRLYIFADQDAGFISAEGVIVVSVPYIEDVVAPILYTVPLQLLSYHVGLIKGTDVDQPRNLAKSVTVE